MTREFPTDVVKTTDKFKAELKQFEGVSVDNIARLWKVYTTQNAAAQDVVVSRLENLFWRIWSNAAVQQSLTGITLATLFMTIHDDSSPLITNRCKPPSLTAKPPTPSDVTDISPVTPVTTNEQPDNRRNESSPRKESKTPLPPILKKPSEGKKSLPPSEPSSHKTTRILIPEKPSQRTPKEVSVIENENSNKAETATTSGVATQKANRGKRPTFVANRAASSRRRGVLMRRKSSQTSPVTSPAVELSEEGLQEQMEAAAKELQQQQQPEEEIPPVSPVKTSDLSWQSMSYLKKLDDEKRKLPTEPEPEKTGTSPPPTNFSLSSVRHHRSPEDYFQMANKEATQNNQVESDKSIVDQNFRTSFSHRQSVFSTRNNSAASSLTTGLSSTNIRELLDAAQAAAVAMGNNDNNRDAIRSLSPGPRSFIPKHDGTISPRAPVLSSPRKSESKDRSRRILITNTSPKGTREQPFDGKDLVSSHSSATAAVAIVSAASESVTSTSQQTTSGVFSVPRESQEQLGEHLSSLIKRKGAAKDGKQMEMRMKKGGSG